MWCWFVDLARSMININNTTNNLDADHHHRTDKIMENATDGIVAEDERKIVQEFSYLLEKSKQLFNGLRWELWAFAIFFVDKLLTLSLLLIQMQKSWIIFLIFDTCMLALHIVLMQVSLEFVFNCESSPAEHDFTKVILHSVKAVYIKRVFFFFQLVKYLMSNLWMSYIQHCTHLNSLLWRYVTLVTSLVSRNLMID